MKNRKDIQSLVNRLVVRNREEIRKITRVELLPGGKIQIYFELSEEVARLRKLDNVCRIFIYDPADESSHEVEDQYIVSGIDFHNIKED